MEKPDSQTPWSMCICGSWKNGSCIIGSLCFSLARGFSARRTGRPSQSRSHRAVRTNRGLSIADFPRGVLKCSSIPSGWSELPSPIASSNTITFWRIEGHGTPQLQEAYDEFHLFHSIDIFSDRQPSYHPMSRCLPKSLDALYVKVQ